MEITDTSPGWYLDPDPDAPRSQYRYWTGKVWTQHTANASQHQAASTKRKRRWVKPTVSAIVLAVLICVVGYLINDNRSKSYPKAWDPQVEPIARQVAKLRGLSFKHPVPVVYLGDQAFRRKVGVTATGLTPEAKHQIENLASTMRALGLIDAQTDLAKSFDTVNQAGVLAYYDPAVEQIVVRGGTGPLDVEHKATLAHELTHVLQDQHFDLQGLRNDARGSDISSSGALTALVEGDAERIKAGYLAGLPDAERAAYDAAETKTGATVGRKLAGTPEIVQIEMSAPYIFGPSVLKVLAAKDGNRAVDVALSRAAPTDAIFLNPAAALKDPEAVAVPPPKVPRGAHQVGNPDTLGAFDLFTVLGSRLDRQVALDASDPWAGDRIVTYRNGKQSCVTATIASKTEAGASTLERALRAWAASMPGATVRADTGALRSTLTSCDGTARPAPDAAHLDGALALLAGRNSILASLLSVKLPVGVGECVSHRLVRTPLFVASLTRNAPLTPSEQAEARAATRTLVAQCSGGGAAG